MNEPSNRRSVPPDVAAALRDAFFRLAQRRSAPDSAQAEAAFRASVDAHDPEPLAVVHGLGLSDHPTARFKAVRFVEADAVAAGLGDPADLARFARPHPDAPELVAVFVDPEELSFRTFENIVPLDRLFARSPLRVELAQVTRLDPALGAYTLAVLPDDATAALLAKVDALDLYAPPLTAGARAGCASSSTPPCWRRR